ncbi:MAG TPA: hypothetical protein PK208_04790 [Fibrobacteria bacterium]|nr:hypothetical protein [Fibrobacteria bacterium]
MDSEIRTPVAPARRGVAMFIVLGAILLVTLFGAVALTLSQRDQTLSGDLNDIKSRDEAALSGLQMAINRLTADPEALLSVLNSFVDQSYAKKGKPDSTWLSLDSSTTLRLLDKEPEWFALSNLPGNQTATKIQLVAVQHADTASEVKLDSSEIYVTLRCLARGRRGDEKSVQATYRIHGITGENKNDTLYYTRPRHSFYLGGRLISTNMMLGTEGNVYVAGTGGSYINSDAEHKVAGDLQWNGDLKLNSSDSIHISGNFYIQGRFSSNGSGLRVDGNLGIGNGFGNMDGTASISVGGNLYIAGASIGPWNSTRGIRVGKSLYYFPTNMHTPKSLVVGDTAWIVRSGTFTLGATDSFYVGQHLFLGDPNYDHAGYVITGGQLFKVGKSLFACRNTQVSLPGGSVGDSIQIDDRLIVQPGKTLSVENSLQVESSITGTVTGATRTTYTTMNWRPWPTMMGMGIDTMLSKTAPQDNPMDSVKVDALHSPQVNNAMIDLTKGMLGSDHFSSARLNRLYDSLKNARKLLNDYMVLKVPSGTTWGIDASPAKFRGKMILVVEGAISVNGDWPASLNRTNIQVLAVRKGGSLGNFGWQDTLSGILYWENPCGQQNFQIAAGGVMVGSILLGTSLATPDFGYSTAELCGTNPLRLTPNAGGLIILRDESVFADIGRNLPGVLAPAKDAAGNPLTVQGTIDVWYYTPRLRLVHDRPFFEPLGVFR